MKRTAWLEVLGAEEEGHFSREPETYLGSLAGRTGHERTRRPSPSAPVTLRGWVIASGPSFQVVLELARVSLLQGHLDLCQQYCAVLLETDKYHETACVVRGPLDLLPPPAGAHNHMQAASQPHNLRGLAHPARGLPGRGDSWRGPAVLQTGGVGCQQGAASTSRDNPGEAVRSIHSRGNHTHRW